MPSLVAITKTPRTMPATSIQPALAHARRTEGEVTVAVVERTTTSAAAKEDDDDDEDDD